MRGVTVTKQKIYISIISLIILSTFIGILVYRFSLSPTASRTTQNLISPTASRTTQNPASAPVTFDSVASANDGGGCATTQLKWTHTTGSIANGILLVYAGLSTGRSVTSISYNGTPITKLGAVDPPGTSGHLEVWDTFNPVAGAHAVNISTSLGGRITGRSIKYSNLGQRPPG